MDALITRRFKSIHDKAIKGELSSWRDNEQGALAEVLILDQFSRNIYRDSPRAFAADPMALTLAQHAISRKQDLRLPVTKRVFLYLPFMHSESQFIHQQALALFSQAGMQDNFDFELKHKDIIDRFGRYPHRNRILSRTSTPAELEFLKQPGSSF